MSARRPPLRALPAIPVAKSSYTRQEFNAALHCVRGNSILNPVAKEYDRQRLLLAELVEYLREHDSLYALEITKRIEEVGQ